MTPGWWDLVYAIAAFLMTFAVMYLLTPGGQAAGWFWTPRESRLANAVGLTLLTGPVMSGLSGVFRAYLIETTLWPAFLASFVPGLGLSLISAWLITRSVPRRPPIPTAVHDFLADWDKSGVGDRPRVEVTRQPPVVRLVFPRPTNLTTAALERLQASLPSFTLVVWAGSDKVFPRPDTHPTSPGGQRHGA